MCISSALATACGIGGGTVYSALLLGVQEFEPLEAFPISNVLILTCGLVTFFACVLDKYKNPKNKFVHYDIAVLVGPSMLLGAKFGTIFNKIFSSLFLTIAVLVVLCYSINSTYKNVQKAKAREAKLLSGNTLPNLKEQILPKEPPAEKIEMIELISAPKDESNLQSNTNNYNTNILSEEDKAIINEDDNPLRMERIKFIAILEVIVVVDQLIEGNSKLPSFLGIRRCSFLYWIVFLGYIGVSLYMIKVAIGEVQTHLEKRKALDSTFKSEVMDRVSNNIIVVICVAVIAGIVSSMVGIGGGMITNPMFASMGLDPKESSSTSNFLIITTAIASTFLFSFAGQLNISFSFWVGIPCTISAFIGSFMILQYINKTKKNSILLVIMLYFLIASMVIILFKALKGIREQSISDIFTFNSFC